MAEVQKLPVDEIATLDYVRNPDREGPGGIYRGSSMLEVLFSHIPAEERAELYRQYDEAWTAANLKDDFQPKIAILQLREDETNHGRRFANMEELNDVLHENPNCNNYELVYLRNADEKTEAEVDQNTLNNSLYDEFNADTLRPSNYYGHSLSVGDVIVISNDFNDQAAYFVDNTGFAKLPEDFLTHEMNAKIRNELDIRQEGILYERINKYGAENMVSIMDKMAQDRYFQITSRYSRVFEMADQRNVLLNEIQDNEFIDNRTEMEVSKIMEKSTLQTEPEVQENTDIDGKSLTLEKRLTQAMEIAGYEPIYVPGHSDDFLMWKEIGKDDSTRFGLDGWYGVADYLEGKVVSGDKEMKYENLIHPQDTVSYYTTAADNTSPHFHKDIGEALQEYNVCEADGKTIGFTINKDLAVPYRQDGIMLQFDASTNRDTVHDNISYNNMTFNEREQVQAAFQKIHNSLSECKLINQESFISQPIKSDQSVKDFIDHLNDPDFKVQKQDYMALIEYVSTVEEQYNTILGELNALKIQISDIKDEKSPLAIMVEKTQKIVFDIGEKLDALKTSIISYTQDALNAAKEKGLSALNSVSGFFKIKDGLQTMNKSLEASINHAEKSIQKINAISREYHEMGNRAANIGRIFMGKESSDMVKENGKLAKALLLPHVEIQKAFTVMSVTVEKAIDKVQRLEEYAVSTKSQIDKDDKSIVKTEADVQVSEAKKVVESGHGGKALEEVSPGEPDQVLTGTSDNLKVAQESNVFVLTEQGYHHRVANGLNDLKAGQSFPEYKNQVPKSWLEKGWVREASTDALPESQSGQTVRTMINIKQPLIDLEP